MRYTQEKAFQKHLLTTNPSSLYLILVEEDYERMQFMKQVAQTFSMDPLQGRRFSAKELPLSTLIEELNHLSLFDSAPLFLVDGVQELTVEVARSWALLLSQAPIAPTKIILGASAKQSLTTVVDAQGVVLDLSEEKPWDKEKRLKELAIQRAERVQKRWDLEALELFFAKLEKKRALIEQEVEKLLLFAYDRPSITVIDVQAITSSSLSYTFWQMAERMVWERAWNDTPNIDIGDLPGFIACLRSQMQLGLSLEELRRDSLLPSKELFPQIRPKLLEQRTQQAERLGLSFFEKGLETLFQLDLLFRSAGLPVQAALDLLRMKWIEAAR